MIIRSPTAGFFRAAIGFVLLALLAACTSLPPTPLRSLTPSSIGAAPVARVTLKVEPDGLPVDDAPDVDEKYRLTGEAARQIERGQASWYGPRFHGRLTASGEVYDMYALTAAHKTLPFGTVVRVRSKALGREVDVRINDRGPFAPGRVIDVSRAAAEALGLLDAGVTDVSLLLLPEVAVPDVDPLPLQKVKRARVSRRPARPRSPGAVRPGARRK
ncbi:MAG: septal ring lytic transglycosylase RlpA family protein [Polaromonas sp.]|nr:septal ring lytic transglycosylase RlpA family protein [Polaromonas sp.]